MMVVIRQVGVVRVVVRAMRRVVGVPGGSGVVVPVWSIAWPAERWSVVLRVMVVGVWWLTMVLSIWMRRPWMRTFCLRYEARRARSASQGGLPGT